jgi:hypothetical protein
MVIMKAVNKAKLGSVFIRSSLTSDPVPLASLLSKDSAIAFRTKLRLDGRYLFPNTMPRSVPVYDFEISFAEVLGIRHETLRRYVGRNVPLLPGRSLLCSQAVAEADD